MNIKMAINSQLSTTESKKQTKQTISTGTESDMEIICRLSVGKGIRENREMVQGLRNIINIIGRNKIDRGRLRIV